ncbi:Multidomain presynaptic cytomatrix related protein [Rasamsonia emersonii CBS 393.64]|uniref:Autophagy-related protein 29 n=1 Tax=Rasamsonia emersonii (strain ATCC 16479 / CBS 393.64 / IMI 116815) TaxID=1408163 RepID=A0A0F4YXG5_RASE3|nr:Multidomain presynaptic cytomatrix related protein [Rasamsonia emersonii CBS 393.64]KKA22929.1 Multidomain presynaptic cytomatrix related protein [Rasamsonia emersonii CBS 393.64]
MARQPRESDVHFTVFIRLPFPRGDFIDPPPTRGERSEQLSDIHHSADDFNVTLPFLLQQVAWLYDRQLSQVRAQMRKVGTTHSHSPSPALGSVSGSGALGGQAMKRAGSGGSRGPSRLSALQKETPPSRVESSPSTRPRGPTSVRTSSTNTVTQAKVAREPSPQRVTPAAAREREPSGRGAPPTRRERPSLAILQKSQKLEEESSSLSSSDESDSESDDDVPSRIPGVRRFGKFSMHKPGLRDGQDENEEDESPAFLPLSRDAPLSTQGRDLNATLRLEEDAPDTHRRRATEHIPPSKQTVQSMSLNSSTSSGVAVGTSETGVPQRADRPPGPISPQRAVGAKRPSPRQPASGKESSEETPSMGSSFSDLDGRHSLNPPP